MEGDGGNIDIQFGTFTEVLKEKGRYYNDHSLILSENTWHFFGIVGTSDPNNLDVKHPADETSIAHATSPDLQNWTIHPDILHATGSWPEESNVFAPNVIEHEGLYYMLYCASDVQHIQRLCLATSPDLFQWEKYSGNPVILPSVYWAEWPGFTVHEPDGHRTFGGCRDAHILKLDDGTHAAYWVSRLRGDKFGPGMVGVAASVSQDLIHWQEVGPIYARKEFHRPLTLEVESPCVVRKDGKYWLFFKHGWWTWYASSDTPFDFWEKEAKQLGYAHAAEIFQWNRQWWITHCQSDPKDFMRSDPEEFMQPETIIGRENNEEWDAKNRQPNRRGRGFFLGKLDWAEGAEPRLI